jgi:magnesium-transporting ATPase (P-type)
MIGWLNGEAILTSISLAVAAIPKLPALVTIALAFGAKRLAKVMHENFRRWKHLARLLISALIKQER